MLSHGVNSILSIQILNILFPVGKMLWTRTLVQGVPWPPKQCILTLQICILTPKFVKEAFSFLLTRCPMTLIHKILGKSLTANMLSLSWLVSTLHITIVQIKKREIPLCVIFGLPSSVQEMLCSLVRLYDVVCRARLIKISILFKSKILAIFWNAVNGQKSYISVIQCCGMKRMLTFINKISQVLHILFTE